MILSPQRQCGAASPQIHRAGSFPRRRQDDSSPHVHDVTFASQTANALWFLSQTPLTRFCPSMPSYIQSRLMPMGVCCQHQPPPTTTTWDRTHPPPEARAEAKEELWQTLCMKLCPIRAEGGATWTKRRGFITTSRCSVTTCIYGFAPTVVSLPPLPPWSGGRSQETDTLSQ